MLLRSLYLLASAPSLYTNFLASALVCGRRTNKVHEAVHLLHIGSCLFRTSLARTGRLSARPFVFR